MPSSPLPPYAAHAAVAPPLRFEQFEVRPATREVWRDGRLQPTPPKVFNLLLMLIERRDRVVPKTEILQAVWGRAVVSESVLARTVMKARKAIGDDARAAPLLRTVHRIGYRFVAPATAEPIAEATTVPSAEPPRGRGARARALARAPADASIALLPIEDATGESDGAWTAQSVRSHCIEMLRTLPPFRLLPESEIQAALGRPEERDGVAAVLALPSVACAVRVTLRRQGRAHWLHYQGIERHGEVWSGSVRGIDTAGLGRRLAERISSRGRDAPGAEAPARFDDPFAREAFSRGLELADQHEWRLALPLLQTASDLQPDHTEARLQCLRAMAACGDAASFVRGARLLADARARRDQGLQALAHLALAAAHRHRDDADADDRADHHLAEALRCAQSQPTQRWAVRLYGALADSAIQRDDTHAARRYLELAERASELSGTTLDLNLAMRATLEIESGQLLEAQRLLDEAQALARRRGDAATAARCQARLAQLHADLGFFDLASSQARAAADELASVVDDCAAADILDGASQVLADAGTHAQIDRMVAMSPLAAGPSPALGATILVAQARAAACRGEIHIACETMQRAVAVAQRRRLLGRLRRWLPHTVCLLTAAGRHEEASAGMQRMQGLARFSTDESLHACALHAQAVGHHAAGDRDAALQCLLAAAEHSPVGRVGSRARLDAAWLLAENGDAGQAIRLVREIGPWLTQHPLGLLTWMRVQHAVGDAQAAHAAFDRLQSRTDGSLRAVATFWWQRCAGASGDPSSELPPATHLPSMASCIATVAEVTSHV